MSGVEPDSAEPPAHRVSLRIQAGCGGDEGTLFENVAVHDTSLSLAEFLDGALKALEVRIV